MTDNPITLTAPEVRAVLDGRKTQKRVALDRLGRFGTIREFGPSDTAGYDWHFRDADARWHGLRQSELDAAIPFAPGMRLWVRETLNLWPGHAEYAVDGLRVFMPHAVAQTWTEDYRSATAPSIHMPRWASRITLHVESVRVERVQAISEADARAEGAPMSWASIERRAGTWRQGFRTLWDSLNARRPGHAWADNPWVAVVQFRAETRNIDAAMAA